MVGREVNNMADDFKRIDTQKMNQFIANEGKYLQRFEISKGHEFFSVIDGVLFNKDATTLIRCPAGYQSPV